MAEIEIGIYKSARRAYGFDDIAIVPSRRTRDPEDVDISWEIDAHRFELPLMAAAMDGVVSPHTAVLIGKLGGLGVLNLEGLWTRYEDPVPLFEEIADLPDDKATARMQQMYSEPIRPDLVTARIKEIKAGGVVAAASVTPQRTAGLAAAILAGELDVLVIQGTVVSAEHVSKTSEPLNLKRFIRSFDIPVIVGGCASYQAALHLMRTGAVGVLVGVGPGNACTSRGVLGIGVPAGDRDRGRGRRPDAASRRDRRLRARHRRRRDQPRRRHREGDHLRCRRGHARLAAVVCRRGPVPGQPLGDGDVPPDAPARDAGPHERARDVGADPSRTGARERRSHEPVRGAPHRHGDVRLRVGQGVPEGRGDDRPCASDRGQGSPARTRRGDGSLSSSTDRHGHGHVLVVDFGAQYSRLIARRVREARVFSEIVRYDTPVDELLARKPRGIILSGGPESVYSDWAPSIDAAVFEAGVPILGICYGAQLMTQALGGTVERTGRGEYGRTTLTRSGSSPLFADWPPGGTSDVWMSHGDAITAAPPGFVATASTPDAPVAAMHDPERRIYGVQFHPEVVHTERGQSLLERFLFDVCAARPTWTHTNIIETSVDAVTRSGRPASRPLRALRRGGLRGRGRARPQGGRRPAHLRVRRHRSDARGRGRAGRRDVHGASSTSTSCT